MAEIEDGYTRIANDLLEAVMLAGLTQHQLLVCLAIMRKTYGFNKKADWISNEQLSQLTGILPHKCSAARSALVKRHIFIQNGRSIGINKDISSWGSLPESGKKSLPKSGNEQVMGDEKTLPESGNIDDETLPESGKESLPKSGNVDSICETVNLPESGNVERVSLPGSGKKSLPKSGKHKRQTTKYKNTKRSTSGNSAESQDERLQKFLSAHPDAAIYTPSGKSWGSQSDLDCAAWIFDRVKIINPTQREPNWTAWANDIRLMRQIDGFTHKQICKLFKHANQDKFWRTNVLCPSKLREKWDTLTAKFNAGELQHGRDTSESNATRQIREAFELWEQGDGEEAVGGDGQDIRPAVDCEEWSHTGRTLDGTNWELD